MFVCLLLYVAFNSQGHIATGSLLVEETSAYCTVNHRASASNYQLSNMKRPARDSNRRPRRLEARTLTTTPPSPLLSLFKDYRLLVFRFCVTVTDNGLKLTFKSASALGSVCSLTIHYQREFFTVFIINFPKEVLYLATCIFLFVLMLAK